MVKSEQTGLTFTTRFRTVPNSGPEMEILQMAEETMQVRLKATPQADAITIKKSEYDPKLHTAVNPNDVPQQFRKTA